ncbi:hypothetical protein C8K44_102195 [Aminobacter sp. AP02]|nr:hypothetical protein C8K44_102195 [Aminobacter sp. AP02]
MHHLRFLKTLAALAAAGFNPRAFLAPRAFGQRLPKPDEPKPSSKPAKEPPIEPDRRSPEPSRRRRTMK